MNWFLPAALGLISVGFITFTGYISIDFVLDRYGHDPFWIILSLVAIAIEVLGFVVLRELSIRKHYATVFFGFIFLCLAVLVTVSFEIGKLSQASSDSVASRQYDTDKFKENRQALSDLRKRRDTALARGRANSAAKYQASIDQLQKWATGTYVSDIDPRASVITRYTGLDPALINDAMAALIILFLLMGRTITPYWTYRLLPMSVNASVNHVEYTELDAVIQLHDQNQNTWTAQSAVEHFVNNNTQSLKGSRTGATDLYRSYSIFAALNGLPWLQQKDFGEALGNHGFEKGRMPGNGAIAYLDIELSAAA